MAAAIIPTAGTDVPSTALHSITDTGGIAVYALAVMGAPHSIRAAAPQGPMPSPLREFSLIAAAVHPLILREFGGGGNCAVHTWVGQLRHRISSPYLADHVTCRGAVVAHAATAAFLARRITSGPDSPGEALTVAVAMANEILAWPPQEASRWARPGDTPVDTWLRAMRAPGTYADLVFHMAACSLFGCWASFVACAPGGQPAGPTHLRPAWVETPRVHTHFAAVSDSHVVGLLAPPALGALDPRGTSTPAPIAQASAPTAQTAHMTRRFAPGSVDGVFARHLAAGSPTTGDPTEEARGALLWPHPHHEMLRDSLSGGWEAHFLRERVHAAIELHPWLARTHRLSTAPPRHVAFSTPLIASTALHGGNPVGLPVDSSPAGGSAAPPLPPQRSPSPALSPDHSGGSGAPPPRARERWPSPEREPMDITPRASPEYDAAAAPVTLSPALENTTPSTAQHSGNRKAAAAPTTR